MVMVVLSPFFFRFASESSLDQARVTPGLEFLPSSDTGTSLIDRMRVVARLNGEVSCCSWIIGVMVPVVGTGFSHKPEAAVSRGC